MPVEGIINEIIRICTDNNALEVILFGSFAKNTAHKTSDIDIAVRTENEDDFYRIEDEISNIDTLRSIDVVNIEQKGLSRNLLEEIKGGKVLYKKV